MLHLERQIPLSPGWELVADSQINEKDEEGLRRIRAIAREAGVRGEIVRIAENYPGGATGCRCGAVTAQGS